MCSFTGACTCDALGGLALGARCCTGDALGGHVGLALGGRGCTGDAHCGLVGLVLGGLALGGLALGGRGCTVGCSVGGLSASVPGPRPCVVDAGRQPRGHYPASRLSAPIFSQQYY